MRLFDIDDLDDLALGAAVLGTGGGGDPYIGRLMAADAIRRHGPVAIAHPDELPDDALVLSAGMMGAPTVMVEKLPNGREMLAAFAAQEAQLGRSASAVMTPEIGGLNSTIAFTVAAARGIPVVDADMVGRAFPELQMCTPTLWGTPAVPLAMADDKGNASTVAAISNKWAERIARAITVEMGCWAMVSLYPLTGRQAREQCIPGSISLASRVGAELRAARRDHRDPVLAVAAATGGQPFWHGKILDVERRTIGGFARGAVTLAGLGVESRRLTIRFQNEFLIAEIDGEPAVTTPDLISVLDAETGEPITTETLRYGTRVTVLAIPGDLRWRSPAGLEIVGPAAFGYDIPFIPFEERLDLTMPGEETAA